MAISFLWQPLSHLCIWSPRAHGSPFPLGPWSCLWASPSHILEMGTTIARIAKWVEVACRPISFYIADLWSQIIDVASSVADQWFGSQVIFTTFMAMFLPFGNYGFLRTGAPLGQWFEHPPFGGGRTPPSDQVFESVQSSLSWTTLRATMHDVG